MLQAVGLCVKVGASISYMYNVFLYKSFVIIMQGSKQMFKKSYAWPHIIYFLSFDCIISNHIKCNLQHFLKISRSLEESSSKSTYSNEASLLDKTHSS